MSFHTIDLLSQTQIRKFHESLNEKDKRRNAASLYLAFAKPHFEKFCRWLAISEKTLRKALVELTLESLPLPKNRQRHPGGGAKKKWDKEEINTIFNAIIAPFTAGDPMDKNVKWTNLSCGDISDLLKGKGIKISNKTVAKLLKKNGFKKRKIQKRRARKVAQDRNEQFVIITQAREDFIRTREPILSIDTKKKEAIGENCREGSAYATGQMNGPDHTYPDLTKYKAVPHGLYDINRNHASLHIGKGSETAELIADSLILWWQKTGKVYYPNAKRILLLFDAGGANSYRHHIFKKEMQRVSNEINLELVIKHYPSYASKWNPIEHRVFPHVSRVIKGVMIYTMDQFLELVGRTKTKKGLSVSVRKLEKEYETGKKATKKDLLKCNIKFPDALPRWNYNISPVF